jgi:hypothetical protein
MSITSISTNIPPHLQNYLAAHNLSAADITPDYADLIKVERYTTG